MASMTIELSEYVIDAIANAVVKKMQEPCDYYDTYNKTCRRSEVPKEPCEDAISRQAVLDGIEELKKSPWASDKLITEALEVVADLCIKQEPSVTPKEPDIDKIRDEIEEYKSRQLTVAIGIENLERGKQIALECVLAIIDRYRAESEGNYGED